MMEDLVRNGPMLIVGSLIVAWIAEAAAAARPGGYGLMPDMALALAGSTLVGGLVWALVWSSAGMVAMLGIGCVGAALAIGAQRLLWRSARLTDA